jgi:hypothetical protein
MAMNDTAKHNDSLERFLQDNTGTPALSIDAKQHMLEAAGKALRNAPENSDDYTWPQFFLRFTSMVAVFCMCILFAELVTIDRPPLQHQQPRQAVIDPDIKQMLSPLMAQLQQRQLPTSGQRWIDYHQKGMLP